MQPGLLEPRRSTAYMMRRDSKPRMSITRRMSAIDFSRSNTRPTRQRQPAPIIPITQGYVLMKKKNLEWRAKQEVQKLDASDGTDYLISNSNQQKFVKSSDLTRKNHSSKLNLIEKGTSEYQDLFCVNDYQKQWSKLAKRKKKKQAFLPSRDLKMQIDQCSIPIRLRKGFAYKGMFYIRKGNYPGRVTFEGKHVDDFVLEIYFNEDDFIQKKVSLIYLSNSFLLKRQATSKDTFYFRLFARKRLVGQLKFDFLIPEEDIPIELRKDYSALELDEHEKIGYIFNRFQSSKAFKEYEKGGVKSTKLAMKRRVPRTIIQANRNIVHQFSPEQRMVRMEENRADKEIRKIEILHRKDRVKKEKSLIKWISTKKNILKKELQDTNKLFEAQWEIDQWFYKNWMLPFFFLKIFEVTTNKYYLMKAVKFNEQIYLKKIAKIQRHYRKTRSDFLNKKGQRSLQYIRMASQLFVNLTLKSAKRKVGSTVGLFITEITKRQLIISKMENFKQSAIGVIERFKRFVKIKESFRTRFMLNFEIARDLIIKRTTHPFELTINEHSMVMLMNTEDILNICDFLFNKNLLRNLENSLYWMKFPCFSTYIHKQSEYKLYIQYLENRALQGETPRIPMIIPKKFSKKKKKKKAKKSYRVNPKIRNNFIESVKEGSELSTKIEQYNKQIMKSLLRAEMPFSIKDLELFIYLQLPLFCQEQM